MGSLEEEIRRQAEREAQARLESEREDQERERLIADFLNIMAKAGNPGLRRWTIRRLGGIKRTGGLFSRRFEDEVLDTYIIEGWLLQSEIIITLDGRFHRFFEYFGENDANWSKADTVTEKYVKFDCSAGDNTTLRAAMARLFRAPDAN
ncbi:hypothetical protein O7627_36750 [Solwaraspora sp. WMMD1047]|uniref:hypothetical protein n=1 Tax=Solwaraspora sp. WMMD1047 TaxID=3016102 RepID=UPI002417180F|nr:hypothetical protein [Solwaraspora sp. WMMD1047]MDG4834820.1 hypothetical protein [Solwaraspora sp. WMMD1047]